MHHLSRFLAFLPKEAWGKPVIGVCPLWFTTLAALALLLSSCATRATSTVTTLTLTTSRQTASATLLHAPTGIVILHWVHKPQVLLVTIGVNGLAPKSLHPIHLHAGSCSHPGKMLVPLPTLIADQAGQAALSARVEVTRIGGLPAVWLINIHNGPTMIAPQGQLALACAPVTRNLLPTAKSDRRVTLQGTTSPNEAASGEARLSLDRTGLLTVSVIVRGLVPLSHHAVHLHTGTCEEQGRVLFSLPPLVANQQGVATEQEQFTGVAALPAHGWYMNVHASATVTTQQGFNPIVCGNVVLS